VGIGALHGLVRRILETKGRLWRFEGVPVRKPRTRGNLCNRAGFKGIVGLKGAAVPREARILR